MTGPDRWEERYVNGDLPWDTGRPCPHLQRLAAKHPLTPGAALELGCGTGTNAIWLAGRGFTVVAVDVSPTAIVKAQEKAAAAGVACEFLAGDFLQEDVPGGPFAFAFDRGCFHSFDEAADRGAFAERVAAQLEEKGLWFSLSGNRDGPEREVGPPRLSAGEIAAAVEPHFEILSLETIHFDSNDADPPRAWAGLMRRRD